MIEGCAAGPDKAVPDDGEGFPKADPGLSQNLGRCAGGGRPEIGDEVGDGEINFVPDGGDHRYGRGPNGTGQGLIVEGPEILETSAAAGQKDDINRDVEGCGNAVQECDPTGKLGGSAFALDPGGSEKDMQPRVAAFQHVQHVTKRRTRGRGNDADGSGIGRQAAFAGVVEQALQFQALFESLERGLECPEPIGLDPPDQELVLAPGFINREFAFDDNPCAVPEVVPSMDLLALEQYALELGGLILEDKVCVAGGLKPEPGDLSVDGDARQSGFEQRPDLSREVGDTDCATWWRAGAWSGVSEVKIPLIAGNARHGG